MKRLTIAIPIAVCLICLIAATSMEDKTINYSEMSEDIEIMSRIFDKKLEDKFQNEYYPGGFIELRLFERDNSLRRTKCRGAYLPDFGVIFTTNVKFPVHKIKSQEMDKKNKMGSLWERMEKGVRNQLGNSTTTNTYEKKKVENLKKLIISTISENAKNIAQLDPDDKITMIVYGGYNNDVVALEMNRHVVATMTPNGAINIRSDDGKKRNKGSQTAVLASNRHKTVLVISVARKFIEDENNLKKHAIINTY